MKLTNILGFAMALLIYMSISEIINIFKRKTYKKIVLNTYIDYYCKNIIKVNIDLFEQVKEDKFLFYLFNKTHGVNSIIILSYFIYLIKNEKNYKNDIMLTRLLNGLDYLLSELKNKGLVNIIAGIENLGLKDIISKNISFIEQEFEKHDVFDFVIHDNNEVNNDNDAICTMMVDVYRFAINISAYEFKYTSCTFNNSKLIEILNNKSFLFSNNKEVFKDIDLPKASAKRLNDFNKVFLTNPIFYTDSHKLLDISKQYSSENEIQDLILERKQKYAVFMQEVYGNNPTEINFLIFKYNLFINNSDFYRKINDPKRFVELLKKILTDGDCKVAESNIKENCLIENKIYNEFKRKKYCNK